METRGQKIDWLLIGPGAALVVLGIFNVGRASEPGTAWANGAPTWPILLAVAIGGVLVLLGVIRTLSRR